MRYYARAFPPVGGTPRGSSGLFSWYGRARDYYFSLSRPKFEALTLAIAMLVGLFIMPVLIYIAGSYVLKSYAHGGLFSLFVDFYKGLVELRPSCWIVLIGPFVFLTFFRLCRYLLGKV
jgi:hypothetical protein